MASYFKTAKGWRVQLSIKGERDSGTFATKAQAAAWAEREMEIHNQSTTKVVLGKTFADACRRYEIENSCDIHKSTGNGTEGWRYLANDACIDFSGNYKVRKKADQTAVTTT